MQAPWLADVLPAALAVAGWWELRGLLYRVHWGRGPTVFLLLLASIALVLVVPWLARMLAENVAGREEAFRLERVAGSAASTRRGWVAGVVLFAVALCALADEARELTINLAIEGAPVVDIGGNTWAAAVRFFDFGENPYTHRTQLIPVTGAPGVVETASGVTMHGVPYYYGFPYFPAMFLSYGPFRLITPGQASIRIGNAFWLVALLAGVGWLAFRLAPPGRRPQAAGLAILLLAVTAGLGGQLFKFGITDILIPAYVVFALVAHTYRRYLLAGALMGLAFAAKLLPGLILAAIFFAWLTRRSGWKPAAAGFLLTSSLFLLPFVVWNAAGFFSATILFYLTHHAAGDSTSLWYYLPASLRLPFLAVGGLAVLALILWPLRSRGDDARGLLRAMVVAAFLFLAFNKMIHLNYQFAVVPLACAVLAADAMGPLRLRDTQAAAAVYTRA